MTTQVEAYELRYHDSGANSHKFYRIYVATTGEWACQWGRIDTNGQMQTGQGQDIRAAQDLTYRKAAEKLAKGYEHYVHRVTFEIPSSASLKGAGVMALSGMFNRALTQIRASGTEEREAAQDQARIEERAKEEAETEKLRQTLTKITAKGKGEPEPAAEPTMADRLAEALEKAKSK